MSRPTSSDLLQIDFIAAMVALLYSAVVVGVPGLAFLAELWVQPAAAAAAGFVALARWRTEILSRKDASASPPAK